jgi:glyoxylase I family protein
MQLEGFAPLIQVYDMPTSVAFYRDILGFEVVGTSPLRGPDDFDWGLLRRDGIELMLNTAYETPDRPPQPDAARVALHDDMTFYFSCPDVDGAYACLQAQGIAVRSPTVAPYGMKQLYLKDPDGYGVCLQWRVA